MRRSRDVKITQFLVFGAFPPWRAVLRGRPHAGTRPRLRTRRLHLENQSATASLRTRRPSPPHAQADDRPPA